MQFGGTEVGIRGVVLVEATVRGIAEQHATAAIRLQPVLVRVDHDRVDFRQLLVGKPVWRVEPGAKAEISPVGGVGMDANVVLLSQLQDGR